MHRVEKLPLDVRCFRVLFIFSSCLQTFKHLSIASGKMLIRCLTMQITSSVWSLLYGSSQRPQLFQVSASTTGKQLVPQVKV